MQIAKRILPITAALLLACSEASAQAATTRLDMLYVELNADTKHVSLFAKSSRLLPECVPLQRTDDGEYGPKCPEMETVINSYGLTFTCTRETPQELSVTIGPLAPSDIKRTVDVLFPSKPIRVSSSVGASSQFAYRELRIEESGYDGSFWLTLAQIEQGLLEALGTVKNNEKLNVSIAGLSFDLRAAHAPPDTFGRFARRCAEGS